VLEIFACQSSRQSQQSQTRLTFPLSPSLALCVRKARFHIFVISYVVTETKVHLKHGKNIFRIADVFELEYEAWCFGPEHTYNSDQCGYNLEMHTSEH